MPRAPRAPKAPAEEKVEVPTEHVESTPANNPEHFQEVTEVEPGVGKTSRKTVFTVRNGAGSPVREYSVEVHGPEAGALAEEYAAKIGGSVA